MRGMFNNCSTLLSIPDLEKWNTSYLIDISKIFEGCDKINKKPLLKRKRHILLE